MLGSNPEADPSEQIITSETAAIISLNRELLSGLLQERRRLLRVSISSLLNKYVDTDSRFRGPLIYDLEPEPVDNPFAFTVSTKELFIASLDYNGLRSIEGQRIPFLRVITNERFYVSGELPRLLSTDFTMDDDNDVYYDTDIVHEENLTTTRSPVFYRDGKGGYSLQNFRDLTQSHLVEASSNLDTQSTLYVPFRRYDSLDDSLYAIEHAENLLSQIKDQEPSYFKPRNDAA